MKDLIRSAEKGFVKNCFLMSRKGEDMIYGDSEGRVLATLDGYAIIPREEYNRLCKIAGEEELPPIKSH